ncbi:hypothetical protein I4U23_030411 [Adineta vaga]|nr:hypothetical protein I4U23_030411 [Adineta vaga]
MKLAEYYHVRTIPTLMAFEGKNLLAPIWQRTAKNVLSSIDASEPMETNEEIFPKRFDDSKTIFMIIDPSLKGSDRVVKKIETSNENKREQYLILLDKNQLTSEQSNLILAMTNEKDRNDFLKSIDQSKSIQSIASSQQSPYIWNQSIATNIENTSQQTESMAEYHGRMISQTALNTITHDNLLKG